MTNTESTNRERASMVSSSSKRFSSIGLLYTVVFFMITSFGTAKVKIISNYRQKHLTISSLIFRISLKR